jgi:hypothetical protein
MPKLSQVSLAGGEVSPSLYARADLQRYASSLRTCRNCFVRATGGVSNRAGLEFVYALDPASRAALIPFVFSTDQSYMLAFQAETVQVFTQGAFVQNGGVAVTNVTDGIVGSSARRTITTTSPHGFTAGQTATVVGVIATGTYNVNGSWVILSVPTTTTFTVAGSGDPQGGYTSGGSVSVALSITTPYQSGDLDSLRYTQSADVLSVVNQLYPPHEFVRTGVSAFSFGEITDLMGGPFLDDNITATTMKSSAATGAVTLTASTSAFLPEHVGSLIRLSMEDLSAIPPWEPNKLIALTTVDPDGLLRRSNGKVYVATGNPVAPAGGTYTGTAAPIHEEGTESDGDGNALPGIANSAAGVKWQYLHSLYGTARITAQAGTTATATVLDYMPVVSPATTTVWSFGAWSEDQGYPAIVTYYQDRLVFANTPEQPQTEWASKTGDYHNFSVSSPLVSDDAIRQTLNARQINAIVELVPMDQLITLTSSSSWASPKRGEAWTPLTVGYDPQSFNGAAFLRAILTEESALFAQSGGRKVRALSYKTDKDKFRGEELTVLARHLFGRNRTIVDMDYATEPYGILWIVRSDGALIGLTYLQEQEVVGWHRHDTQGYFERVCVIPEDGRDVPYFVVRRTINGATVRYLERMAERDQDDILDSFFVDSGLTYDGRNDTETTVTISGASYDGGQSVTLTASSSLFEEADIGDAIHFPSDDGNVRAQITSFTSILSVTALLQSPVPVNLQSIATATWTFARDTFSGLDHLEGEAVAILADGSPEAQQVVANGAVTLAYPAGVVHIGLAYTSDIETLDLTIFGASETIRDSAKRVTGVSVVVEKTLGLQYGANADNLYDLQDQPIDFDYSEAFELQDDVHTKSIATGWDKNGRVFFRQSDPLPATILAIIPKVTVGED